MTHSLTLRELRLEDKAQFINAVRESVDLHYPWVAPPHTDDTFFDYFNQFLEPNRRCYVLVKDDIYLVGTFGISEIVRGCFESAYLGYYAFSGFNAKGYMSIGLKLLLKEIFTTLKLHRIEANIQPDNLASILLVKINRFRLEGYSKNYLQMNGVWKDHERWAMTLEDWDSL